jgi:hypothetical protein
MISPYTSNMLRYKVMTSSSSESKMNILGEYCLQRSHHRNESISCLCSSDALETPNLKMPAVLQQILFSIPQRAREQVDLIL